MYKLEAAATRNRGVMQRWISLHVTIDSTDADQSAHTIDPACRPILANQLSRSSQPPPL